MTATTTGQSTAEDAGNPARGPVAGASAHSHGAGATIPDQSRAERLSSFDPADFGIPTGREEVWRFTPMDRLGGLHTGVAASGEAPQVQVEAPTGYLVERVGREDPRLGQVGKPEDKVTAEAWARFDHALVVTVGAEQELTDPCTVAFTGRGGTSYNHLLVRAERFGSGVVVLDHRGSGTVAANVELDLADGARLTVISIQDWDDSAVHVASQRARLGRDARLKHVVVTLGGDVVRLTPTATFTGPGAEVEMLGLYFADAGQHLQHQLFVDHAVPHCRSNVTYKGALQGTDAHTVWVGDVLIRAAAEGTDTYELNRNLVLTDGARADSVPNLEIETGEIVGAGHASATGRFDDEQLFYLQSRGIEESEARRMVVRGFFAELLQRIGVDALQERLMSAIDAELAAVSGGQA